MNYYFDRHLKTMKLILDGEDSDDSFNNKTIADKLREIKSLLKRDDVDRNITSTYDKEHRKICNLLLMKNDLGRW